MKTFEEIAKKYFEVHQRIIEHPEFNAGCKGSCGMIELVESFHNNIDQKTYYIRFGGYCFVGASRWEQFDSYDLEDLLNQMDKFLEKNKIE